MTIVIARASEDGPILAAQRQAFEVEGIGRTALDGKAAIGRAQRVGAGRITIDEIGDVLRFASDADVISTDGGGHVACCWSPDARLGRSIFDIDQVVIDTHHRIGGRE